MVLAVLAVYLPHVQTAAFVYEDHQVIQAERQGWRRALTTGRGLTRDSWSSINTPRAAHALNLGLHLIVAGLVGLLCWRIWGDAVRTLGGAGIVALHPIGIEAVAYAASRAELLAAVGVLTALVLLTCRARWWALVPLALWLGWTGKESAIVGIGLVPLVLWLRHDTRWRWVLGVLWGAVVVTAVLWMPHLAGWLLIGHTPRVQVDGWTWLLMQTEAVWRLVVLSVAPFWLSVSPDITGPSLAGVAALILLVAVCEVAWRGRRSSPMFFAGIAWLAIVAAPRLLVRTPLSPFNEHQWYLALPGVALVLMAGLETCASVVEGRRRVRLA